MSFKEDIAATPGVEKAWRAGLQALRSCDLGCVSVAQTKKLRGSVDIDGSLKRHYPNDARWDYVVAQLQGKGEFLNWIEIHPAGGESTIGEIGEKIHWLKEWLKADGKLLDKYPRQFLWIASGTSSFTRNHPRLKSLAAKGVHFCGRYKRL